MDRATELAALLRRDAERCRRLALLEAGRAPFDPTLASELADAYERRAAHIEAEAAAQAQTAAHIEAIPGLLEQQLQSEVDLM